MGGPGRSLVVGGCELAMMCGIIIAAQCARFALPEPTIGIIPGAGGTRRLTRVVGKALAMDMILTGRVLSAEEARAAGLGARAVADGAHVDTAVEMAARIAPKLKADCYDRERSRQHGLLDPPSRRHPP